MIKNIISVIFFLAIIYFGIIIHDYPFVLFGAYLGFIPSFYFAKIKKETKTFKWTNIPAIKFLDWVKLLLVIFTSLNMMFFIKMSISNAVFVSIFFILKIIFTLEAIGYSVMVLSNEQALEETSSS